MDLRPHNKRQFNNDWTTSDDSTKRQFNKRQFTKTTIQQNDNSKLTLLKWRLFNKGHFKSQTIQQSYHFKTRQFNK